MSSTTTSTTQPTSVPTTFAIGQRIENLEKEGRPETWNSPRPLVGIGGGTVVGIIVKLDNKITSDSREDPDITHGIIGENPSGYQTTQVFMKVKTD
jgi:hypothetical protein